ncbi:hypothetical protein [Paenibacillus sp. BK033]|uniref:hypothetical protein n=1 Tax=Paenibacillus sp. BK033 TaxID=2512133 RepID=UPI001048097F|nr:hypothetical protein [Paenibacillus sp. BK033]
MNSPFIFVTDENALKLCLDISKKMIEAFSITYDESIYRINRHWSHLDEINEESIIFHENAEFWAYDIYYGISSGWWNRIGDKTLRPVPIED